MTDNSSLLAACRRTIREAWSKRDLPGQRNAIRLAIRTLRKGRRVC